MCVSVSVSTTVCMHKCGYEIANRRIQHVVTRSWHIHDNDGPQGKLDGDGIYAVNRLTRNCDASSKKQVRGPSRHSDNKFDMKPASS